jgi:hypothetical protein
VRFSRCDVRDHMNYRKSDRLHSYRFYRALQRQKSPMRYICEIFGAPRFSSFSTQSAGSGPPPHALEMVNSELPFAEPLLRPARRPPSWLRAKWQY